MPAPTEKQSLEEFLRSMVRTARDARLEAAAGNQQAAHKPIVPVLVLQTPVPGMQEHTEAHH